jgi:uncharacterized protein
LCSPVTTPTARLPRTPTWGLFDVVITLVLTVVLVVVVSIAMEIISAPLGAVVILGSLVSWVGLAGWPILAAKFRGNGAVIDFDIRFSASDIRWGVIGGAVGLGLAALAAGITMLIVGDFNSAAGVAAEQLVQQSGVLVWVIFGLLLMVGAPIAEELAFRGLFFGALVKRGIRPTWVIIITAAAFALFHFEPQRMLVLFVVGLTFGYVRYKSGSLGAAMIAHGVNNAPAALYVMVGMPEVTP